MIILFFGTEGLIQLCGLMDFKDGIEIRSTSARLCTKKREFKEQLKSLS